MFCGACDQKLAHRGAERGLCIKAVALNNSCCKLLNGHINVLHFQIATGMHESKEN